jgi:dolichol-phosphate mannosyltransferase
MPERAPVREQQPATPHVAVVIPTYRAAPHIAGVIRGIPEWVRTIVVVDDCSPDDSAAIAGALGDARVRVVRHEVNQGVGGATLTGYREALRLGARVLVKMDADGQMDPAALPALVGPVLRGEADYTKGNRFLHARELRQMPFVRRFGNLGLSFITKASTGYWRMFDPTNGYTALHASVAGVLDDRAIARRYFFETSLLLELSMHRAVVRDVFIPARYGTEQSHLSEWKALLGFPPRQLRGLLRRLWTQYFLRDFGLMPMFLLAGLAAFGFGIVFGAFSWYRSASTGVPASTGTVMLSVLPIIVGVQFLLQAITLDVQAEPQQPLHHDLEAEARMQEQLAPGGERARSGVAKVAHEQHLAG